MSSFDRCTRPLVSALNGQKTRNWRGRVQKTELHLSAEQFHPAHGKAAIGRGNEGQAPAERLKTETESTGTESTGTGTSAPVEAEAVEDSSPGRDSTDRGPATPRRQQLPLEIDGVTYLFEYDAAVDAAERQHSAKALADSFCSEHGNRLLEKHNVDNADTTEQQRLVREECYLPILGALEANMVPV
jgi:hypothetical protein